MRIASNSLSTLIAFYHSELNTIYEASEIDAILKERRRNWKPREPKYKKGVLRLFSLHAASPMKGAYLEY